jgi:phosphomannomutase
MMQAAQIHFGTDGWRGVIADDFNYANVRRVAQGAADYMRSSTADPLAVVDQE